jgi:AcrR family transcriptional regulator
MPRPTKQDPERGDARTMLLEAARDVIRAPGFSATTVDDLCRTAGVTKEAFFHHFASKEALGVAAAAFWARDAQAVEMEPSGTSTTDPRRAPVPQESRGSGAIHCFMGNTLIESRDGLIVQAEVTDGHTERRAALGDDPPPCARISAPADAGGRRGLRPGALARCTSSSAISWSPSRA